jgi:hypothetical protein
MNKGGRYEASNLKEFRGHDTNFWHKKNLRGEWWQKGGLITTRHP